MFRVAFAEMQNHCCIIDARVEPIILIRIKFTCSKRCTIHVPVQKKNKFDDLNSP